MGQSRHEERWWPGPGRSTTQTNHMMILVIIGGILLTASNCHYDYSTESWGQHSVTVWDEQYCMHKLMCTKDKPWPWPWPWYHLWPLVVRINPVVLYRYANARPESVPVSHLSHSWAIVISKLGYCKVRARSMGRKNSPRVDAFYK